MSPHGGFEPTIVIDRCEQMPYRFDTPSNVHALPAGDYNVLGLETRIAIERKSLADLLGSLTRGRDRFERKLAKARSYERFFVPCKTSPDVILGGKFGHLSQANPRAIGESICCFSVRYPALFLFAGDRLTAQRMAQSLLTKFAREHIRAVEEMTRAAKKLARAS